MSFERRGDGFFQPPLSIFKKQDEYIKYLKANPPEPATEQDLSLQMCGSIPIHTEAQREILKKACNRVALFIMLEESKYAERLLTAEEYEKAYNSYRRKQYDSKLLKRLLDYFGVLLNLSFRDLGGSEERFTLYYLGNIKREYLLIEEELVSKEFAPLKAVINEVASGVLSSCYLEHGVLDRYHITSIPEHYNDILKEKAGYDYNKAHGKGGTRFSYLFRLESSDLLFSLWQSCLLDDAKFWEGYKDFSVFSFLESVRSANSPRHADKIFAHICRELLKKPNIALLMKHGLPLYMNDEATLIEQLEDQAYRHSFSRLRSYCNIDLLKEEKLCVPMSRVEEEKLKIGKELFERWIKEYNFPTDGERVLEYIRTELDAFSKNETPDRSALAVILDGHFFGFYPWCNDRLVFSLYCPDCFSGENILFRAYAVAYAVTRLSDSELARFGFLNRIYVDLLLALEERLGIYTSHKQDLSSRNASYKALKDKMSELGEDISDTHKESYIIALLDRDVATRSEEEKLPELEQLGDAVYGFAVAERLFYQPKCEESFAKLLEKYSSASAQIEVSKKFGFDKFYLRTAFSAQYEDPFVTGAQNDFISSEAERQNEVQKKYLADSLEMIIGALCLDKGAERAIAFAKRLLEESFPEDLGGEEIHFSPENLNLFTDVYYWDRIRPAPSYCTYGDCRNMMLAFDKLMAVLAIGTDNKDKRNYITQNASSPSSLFEKLKFWPFYFYLCKGLPFAIERYSDKAIETYNKNKSDYIV